MEKMSKQQAEELKDKIFQQFGISLKMSRPLYEHRINEADIEYYFLILFYGAADEWQVRPLLVINNEEQWNYLKVLVVDIAQRISDYSQSVLADAPEASIAVVDLEEEIPQEEDSSFIRVSGGYKPFDFGNLSNDQAEEVLRKAKEKMH